MRRGRDRDHARHHSQTGHSDNAARSPVQRGHRPGCCSQRTSGPDRAGQEDHARAAALKPPPPPPPRGCGRSGPSRDHQPKGSSLGLLPSRALPETQRHPQNYPRGGISFVFINLRVAEAVVPSLITSRDTAARPPATPSRMYHSCPTTRTHAHTNWTSLFTSREAYWSPQAHLPPNQGENCTPGEGCQGKRSQGTWDQANLLSAVSVCLCVAGRQLVRVCVCTCL